MAEVVAQVPGDARLNRCIQCGSCGGSCPAGADMDWTPRGLFALIAANHREEAIAANTMWYCVSCYRCAVRCPQEIHITDLMYALKRMATQEGARPTTPSPEARSLSRTFADQVERYGRSFELGLIALHHLRMHPVQASRMTPVGWFLLKNKRMDLRPHRIKGVKQLRAILAKARQIETEA